LINDPGKGLATDFQILVTPPHTPKNKINRKRPLKWWDRNNLEAAQKLLVEYPGAIAVYIPNKLIVTDYATNEENAKLKDFYDASKSRAMPHHPIRDQEKIRKELQLKNVKRHGQINDEL
jgi:NADH dehydrogenase/NADH:ubiquinone oxidoreductase subunit G